MKLAIAKSTSKFGCHACRSAEILSEPSNTAKEHLTNA